MLRYAMPIIAQLLPLLSELLMLLRRFLRKEFDALFFRLRCRHAAYAATF